MIDVLSVGDSLGVSIRVFPHISVTYIALHGLPLDTWQPGYSLQQGLAPKLCDGV